MPVGFTAQRRSGRRREAPTVTRQRAGCDRAGSNREAGAATLEIVVLFPFLLLLVFAVIQGALFLHARNVALAAAVAGVQAGRAARVAQPTATATSGARSFLRDAGELPNLTALHVIGAMRGGRLVVIVTAHTLSLVPGLNGPAVVGTASAPLERFTTTGAP